MTAQPVGEPDDEHDEGSAQPGAGNHREGLGLREDPGVKEADSCGGDR